ncbi:MAG: hypothetical protein IAF94_21970 [Pirellulaceae bacterium]|nr:hypothetical protein [Pirellulaceae bacterium]
MLNAVNQSIMSAALTLTLSLAAVAPAQEPTAGNGRAGEFRSQVESLIAQLRSPNKDPNPKSEPRIDFPDDYDHKAQSKVEEAIEALKSLGKAAFPILIEHADDPQYSKSISSAVLLSRSVGEVCGDLVEDQVDLSPMNYKSRKGKNGKHHGFHRDYFGKYWKGVKSRREMLEKWWMENSDKSLQEMQIEALESAISDEKAIGFPTKRDEEFYLKPLEKNLKDVRKR